MLVVQSITILFMYHVIQRQSSSACHTLRLVPFRYLHNNTTYQIIGNLRPMAPIIALYQQIPVFNTTSSMILLPAYQNVWLVENDVLRLPSSLVMTIGSILYRQNIKMSSTVHQSDAHANMSNHNYYSLSYLPTGNKQSPPPLFY